MEQPALRRTLTLFNPLAPNWKDSRALLFTMLTMLAVPLKLPTPDSGILDLENFAQVWRRGKWDFPVYLWTSHSWCLSLITDWKALPQKAFFGLYNIDLSTQKAFFGLYNIDLSTQKAFFGLYNISISGIIYMPVFIRMLLGWMVSIILSHSLPITISSHPISITILYSIHYSDKRSALGWHLQFVYWYSYKYESYWRLRRTLPIHKLYSAGKLNYKLPDSALLTPPPLNGATATHIQTMYSTVSSTVWYSRKVFLSWNIFSHREAESGKQDFISQR